MRRRLLFLSALLLSGLAVGNLWANDPVRRVQEELRRRNLFFGDINGRVTPELVAAVRVYQSHKGFAPSGEIDETTARSLNVETGHAAPLEPSAKWPDLPVLKSDAARELSPTEQAALQQAAVADINASPSPEIPAEAPSGAQNLDPEQVTKFVRDYLRAGETNDLASQMAYYGFPVDYFTHGRVGETFVAKDNRNYMQRWTRRSYELAGPVKFAAGPAAGETTVEFPITFRVQNQKHQVAGKTRNFLTIKPNGNGLKILSIREERLRE